MAEDEINCIRSHKEEAIPTLIQYVKAVVDDDITKNYEAHNYAMFLLAEFKIKEAFQYLIKYLELDTDTLNQLLGDLLFESFSGILASCAEYSDIPKLKSIIENQELDWGNRSTAVSALVVLYVEGVYPRNEICDYFGYLLNNYSCDDEFTDFLICDALDIYASEYFDLMRSFFKNGMLGDRIMDIEDFEDDVSKGEATALENLKHNHHYRYITDTVKSMEWWACFKEKPDFGRKIGRNEPCPCGSGKKYKKCCGA